jgi:tetratricopeptide (TPR) repeat protein/transglutaminase-like putative cysteine protease
MVRRGSLVLVLLAVFAASATPQLAFADAEAWPVVRGPSREPVPFRYDPKQWKSVPREFLDDSAACTLYSGNTYLVEPDGTTEVVTHEITRLGGRKAIEKLGEYRSISYDPAYQKLTLNEARVHKADGRIVPIGPRHIQLRDVSTDYQVYDTDKQVIISFPSLEVGDTIEVKWTLRGKNPEHGGQFFTRYSFGDVTYPVALDELRIRVPKNKPFHFASLNKKIEPVKTVEGDNIVYHWKAINCKRPPQDDNLPPKDELRPTLACSTFASWEEIGQWKQRLRADCWKCSDELRKVVAEVTAGLTDPTAKARALTYWLRRNIRYVSAGEKHDYTPHAPGTVLANRYGDCKDTSQMLAVMLREAGIKVELATLGVYDDGQVLQDVPSPWGTHAILLATIDGKPHWIDTTASLAGWDFLPRDDHDRLCYLVDDKGKIRLDRTPAFTPEENRFETVTNMSIGADGSSRSERKVVSTGSAAMGQRDLFLEVPSGERRRQAASELQDSNNQTRLVHLAVDEAALRNFDRPTSVDMTFEIPGHFTGSPDREGNFSDSKIWGRLLSHNIDYDRAAPLQLLSPFESRHRYIVRVHPAYTVESVPRERRVTSKWGVHKRTVKSDGDVLEVEFFTRVDKTRVDPDDFDRFRTFQDEVNKSYRAWLTLKPTQELADAPLLEALCRLAPEDGACAAVLAQLYQSNHKSADARRVLERARFYRPDDVTLGELAIKCAANPEDEEKIQRELMERFPDDAKYALGLADVLIQRKRQDDARKLLLPLTTKGTPANRAKALFYLARSHYRTDELEPALEHLTAAEKIDPDAVHTVRGYQLKGQILEELRRLPEAVDAFQQELALDAEASFALDHLVRLMLADNKPREAMTYLRRYVVVVGEERAGLLLAAESYLKLGRLDEAFELAARVLQHDPQDKKAERLLGLVLLQRGKFAEAVEHLDKASEDAAVLDGLIQAGLAQGRLDEVAARLDKANSIDKPTPELKKNVERAQKLLERRAELLKQTPGPAEKEALRKETLAFVACAEEAARDGKSADADRLLQLAMGKGLESGAALGLRARLTLERGKLTRALADAERAIQICPNQANGYYVRGRIRLERGQATALVDLEKAVALSGQTDADMLHVLAAALAEAGRGPDALTMQRKAVKIKPQDKEMAEQLDTLEKRIQPRNVPKTSS